MLIVLKYDKTNNMFINTVICMVIQIFIHVYRYAITKAKVFKKKFENSEKAKWLKTDITNGHNHLFGSHDKCDM